LENIEERGTRIISEIMDLLKTIYRTLLKALKKTSMVQNKYTSGETFENYLE
jgi:hypothetical protein